MPDGVTHTTHATVLAIGVAAGLSLQIAFRGHISPWVATWVLAGVFITPDHDLHPNITYAMVERVFGKPGRWVWGAIWQPYAALLPHRGISHLPVIGTMTRVFWLLILTALFDGVAHGIGTFLGLCAFGFTIFPKAVAWLGSPSGISAMAFLSMSDILHETQDVVSTFSKRKRGHKTPSADWKSRPVKVKKRKR